MEVLYHTPVSLTPHPKADFCLLLVSTSNNAPEADDDDLVCQHEVSDKRENERLRNEGRKMKLIYEMIRKLECGYFFKGHDSTKVRTLAREERRDRGGGKQRSFGKVWC